MDFGSNSNQKLHAWMFSQFLQALKGQCRQFGLQVTLVDEAYTSQTCPWTGARRKPKGRLFISPCGHHRMDRDGVGAVNIRQKYLEVQAGPETAYGCSPSKPWLPVLVGMAPTTQGVRFRVSHASPKQRGTVPQTGRIPRL